MLLDQVTEPQIRAVQMMTAATMAAFVGAAFAGKWAARIRMAAAILYIAAALGFVVWFAI